MLICNVLLSVIVFLLPIQSKSVLNKNFLEKIEDLTWDFDESAIAWDEGGQFTFSKKFAAPLPKIGWYSTNSFCMDEHSGTHFDAPYHFFKNGQTVANVPIERLIAEGAFLDLTSRVEKSGKQTLVTPQDLQDWETKNGPFKNNTVLLIKFNWSRFWPNRTEYFGIDDEGNKNFPGLSAEAAQWIADTGKFAGVGVDTGSVDPGNSQEFPVHQTLNQHSIYIIENVKLVNDLPATNFTVLVMPLKIKEGSGGPTRIVAVPKGIL